MKTTFASIAIVVVTITGSMGFQQSPGRVSPIASVERTLKPLQSSVLDELSTVGENTRSGSTTSELPPLLQDMVNERRNFEMNLGRAMDVLRKDYPYMLYKTPGKCTIVCRILGHYSRIYIHFILSGSNTRYSLLLH